jgi:glycosyltransferase involved in cell wall biosynthesis
MRLSREKRIRLLIEAFARLASKYPEWHVLLLGDGPDGEAIASLVNMRGLRQPVALAGAVADAAQSAMAACIHVGLRGISERACGGAMAVELPSLSAAV